MLLNQESQLELLWWVKKIEIYNGRTLIQLPAQALLQADVLLTGWGAVWEGMKTGGTWNQQERRMHINEMELLALKLVLETFLKAQEIKSLHIQMDKIVTLTYFLKMGDTKNLQMICLSKQIWKLLLRKKVTVTVRVSSQHTEQACRHRISSQDRFFGMEASPLSVPKTLCENDKAINRPLYFQGISPASNNVAWRRKPYSLATNAFSITWNKEFYYAFPPSCLIAQVLNEIEK